MTKLSTIVGAFLGHLSKAFTLTSGVLLALCLWLDPEWVGKWQADVECSFVEGQSK